MSFFDELDDITVDSENGQDSQEEHICEACTGAHCGNIECNMNLGVAYENTSNRH